MRQIKMPAKVFEESNYSTRANCYRSGTEAGPSLDELPIADPSSLTAARRRRTGASWVAALDPSTEEAEESCDAG
jgi:hypothetical protein